MIEGTSPPEARVPRAVWIVGVLAVVATVVVTWLVVAVAHVGRDGAAAGTIYHDRGSEQTYATTASVRLPGSTLTVRATTAQSRLPHDVAEFYADGPQLPPVDGRWVGVTWSTSFPDDSGVPRLLGRVGMLPSLSVRTQGHTYPLQPAGVGRAYCTTVCFDSGQEWVAIDGDGHDLTAAVAFDGVVQTVDLRTGAIDRGRAAPVYTSAPSDQRDCGSPALSGGFRRDYISACSVTVARGPWAPGLGWAPSGQQWVVALASVPRRAQVRLGTQSLDSFYDAQTVRFTASGVHLVRRTDFSGGELHADSYGTPVIALVYRAATGAAARLTIAAQYPLQPESDSTPVTAADAAVTATWTVTL